MNVIFTIEQLNAILAYCDQLPYRLAKPLIDQIQSIAEPQIKEQIPIQTPVEVVPE
jgi:hypothetical protein